MQKIKCFGMARLVAAKLSAINYCSNPSVAFPYFALDWFTDRYPALLCFLNTFWIWRISIIQLAGDLTRAIRKCWEIWWSQQEHHTPSVIWKLSWFVCDWSSCVNMGFIFKCDYSVMKVCWSHISGMPNGFPDSNDMLSVILYIVWPERRCHQWRKFSSNLFWMSDK